MILTDYFTCTPGMAWRYAKQCGVDYGTVRLPEDAAFDFKSLAHWREICNRFQSFGIQPLVLEPLPNTLHEHIKTGDSKRDESIETFIKMLPNMKACGIQTVCFNFMAYVGWLRTELSLPERGNALVTGFNLKNYTPTPHAITAAALWQNYEYFLKAVLPWAEKYEVRLALHPDDPPVPRLGGVERIMTSYQNIQRAMQIVPSEMLGVTMCQATYHAMGEKLEQVIPALKNKIFFVHFRNITGTKTHFRETFHDNGDLNMAGLIRLYCSLGLHVPIRVDHVPLMAGEANNNPGYTELGRLFAIGYLKGLLAACEKQGELE